MTAKDTLAACRIRFIEGLLEKLERELESAEGADREALRDLQKRALRELRTRRSRVQQTPGTLGRHPSQ